MQKPQILWRNQTPSLISKTRMEKLKQEWSAVAGFGKSALAGSKLIQLR